MVSFVIFGFLAEMDIDDRFDALALSFNGGKDCLVLLLLYIYVLHTQHPFPSISNPSNTTSTPSTPSTPSRSTFPHKIPTCFVTPPQTFPEVDSFVTSCATRYNLDVERISLPMKPAFTQVLPPPLEALVDIVPTTTYGGQSRSCRDSTD